MRVAVMFNPDTSAQSKFYMQAIEAAAPSLGVQVIATPVRSAGDIEVALESFARLPNGGLMLTTDSFTGLHYPLIADLARRFRLPSIGQTRNFAKDGGLMFYGNENDLIGQWRQPQATWIASSRVQNLVTCRSRKQTDTRSSST
jgi:ABC-type uncharacterized transport system substrate-binding protein